MVGMFVCLCLASQNPFEREFFVPARTDLGGVLLDKDCRITDSHVEPTYA